VTLVIEDPKLCGLGEGPACCGFLMAGMHFECGREIVGINTTLRARLDAGVMNAKGDPGDAPYPECQTARLS
jgi:hypothetical protein